MPSWKEVIKTMRINKKLLTTLIPALALLLALGLLILLESLSH